MKGSEAVTETISIKIRPEVKFWLRFGKLAFLMFSKYHWAFTPTMAVQLQYLRIGKFAARAFNFFIDH